MLKKIIIVILALATIWFIGDTNLKGNSVYYAKHSPSSNVRDLELMMFTENLDILDKKDGFKYKHKIQEEKSVQNVKKNVYVGNNRQRIDISTVDENKIKEEIYENFKPILKELENYEPDINLQWIFNWVYRDRIK